MKKQLRIQMQTGREMIASAEFEYGFKMINREEFDARIAKGNQLILAGLDGELIPVSA